MCYWEELRKEQRRDCRGNFLHILIIPFPQGSCVLLYRWRLMMVLALNVYSDSAEVQGCYGVPAHPFRRIVSRSGEVWVPENPAAAFLVADSDIQRIGICCCVTVLCRWPIGSVVKNLSPVAGLWHSLMYKLELFFSGYICQVLCQFSERGQRRSVSYMLTYWKAT